ncbi:MAG: hypothetical protein WBW53_15830 [Terriglobales bacterium]
MRRATISLLLLIFIFALSLCASGKNESLDELKARYDKARIEDRAELAIRIAQLQLHNADKLYDDGKVDAARAAVNDVVSYSEKARDAAAHTNKHLKNVEIDVRKMADKLRDIKRSLAFEDQAPVGQAIRQLEDVRTTLLNQMFPSDDQEKK